MSKRTISRLRPRTKYAITIRATDGEEEGPEQTYWAFTSPQPVDNVRVTMRFQNGVNIEWDEPRSGADMYRITNVDNEEEIYFANTNQIYVEMDPGKLFQITNFLIFSPKVKNRSKTFGQFWVAYRNFRYSRKKSGFLIG